MAEKEKSMNPQPHPFVGQLGVLIFVLLIVYFSLTNKKRQCAFSDKFTIGYISDDQPVVMQQIDNIAKKMATQPKYNKNKKNAIPYYLITPIVENKKTINQNLVNDCISALVSLGTKKMQAKQITKEIFETHNPSTIEEFIKFVYIK
jgi:Holliday junction resolvasome RuvABC DNA-binding subunit